MGEVWRARHRRTGAVAAIKVILSDVRFRAVFLREVQAVAALNHPNIVAIYDFGEIEDEDGHTFPWFAMELATTSLAEIRVQRWSQLRPVLEQTLDALGHAHARSVIHRDLKPENILIGEDNLIKLTDFGMAHTPESSSSTSHVFGPGGGTPEFMAPEQFRGEWRKFGPWTDLYALGCVAWELATGAPPFAAVSVVDLAVQHMADDPPPFLPRFPVPERFVSWLHRLLEKHPLERYRRAADAAWALLQDVGTVAPVDFDPETINDAPPEYRETLLDAEMVQPDRAAMPTVHRTYGFAPPVAPTWRVDHLLKQLPGAGLGLFGLREIPFVGRDSGRDYFWERLQSVAQSAQNEVLFVHGDVGVGRTRFGQWLSRRAHELGAATVVRVTHGPIQSNEDGLVGGVRRFLGIERVDDTRAYDIVLHRLGPSFDPSLLFAMLTPPTKEPTLGNTGMIGDERYAAFERLLAQLSMERAVILLVDDAQWGADALMFVQYLATRGTRTLVVVNVRDDVLPERQWEARLISEIALEPRASSIHLQPLTHAEQLSLMHEMLDLNDEVAELVVARTQGVPLFATQLVGDWVQRGVLVESDEGFRLASGVRPTLPDDVYELWNNRLNEIENSLVGVDLRAVLEAAALLGRGDASELAAVCAELGLSAPRVFVDELESRRLIVREPGGWTFQHGMLREALERSATESGRAPAIYRAAASQCESADPYRSAELRIRAGDFEQAIDGLLNALDAGIQSLAADQARQVIGTVNELLEATEAPESDVRRGRLLALEVELARVSGDVQLATQAANDLAKRAERFQWVREHSWAMLHLAVLGDLANDRERTLLERFESARRGFDQCGDQVGRAEMLRSLARFQLRRGKPQEAAGLIRKAREIATAIGDVNGELECLIALGHAALAAHDLESAKVELERACELAETHRLRMLIAQAHDGLGLVAQAAKDFEAAEDHFQRAHEIWTALGSRTAHVAEAHLALLMLEREFYTFARGALAHLRQLDLASRLPNVAQAVTAGLMLCAAVDQDAWFFDKLNHELREQLRGTSAPDPSVPRFAFQAGEKFAAAGDKLRARKSFDVARNVYMALHERERADQVAFAIGRL